jgi:hypothetical protein
LRVGFPHSEIRGSKLVCQLPAAYRRLRRPSSPVIAKASTTCTCSLDPITLSPRAHLRKSARRFRATGELVFAAFEILIRSLLCSSEGALERNDTILPIPIHRLPRAKHRTRFATNRNLYFFRIVKERYSRSTHRESTVIDSV